MLTVINNPLVKTKVDILRDKNTSNELFRTNLKKIAGLVSYEAFKDLELYQDSKNPITTPTNCIVNPYKLKEDVLLVPVLRAGLGMLDGILEMIPEAKVGHIGMYRDEKTLQPHEYYVKLPKLDNPLVVIIDPMLATGGSAISAIQAIKNRGYKKIIMINLVGAPQGVELVEKHHPDVHIYLASLDEKLNEHGYILPGLGDAGDRIFGTD